MKWITRERPKIDRIACPWLIGRFIDQAAEFIFAPPADVKRLAQELDAIPFDVEGPCWRSISSTTRRSRNWR